VTFLDLRTLAATRAVVGPDDSFSKLFANTVKLRETKMPRTLYFEDPGDHFDEHFDFSDLCVSKSAAAFEAPNFGYEIYPAEVLRSAAYLRASLLLALPRDLETLERMAQCKKDTIAVYQEWRDVANEELWVDVVIRPLALADEADRVVSWDEGVFTFIEEVKCNLALASVTVHQQRMPSDAEPHFPIVVKSLYGKPVQLEVSGSSTIHDVKEMLQNRPELGCFKFAPLDCRSPEVSPVDDTLGAFHRPQALRAPSPSLVARRAG